VVTHEVILRWRGDIAGGMRIGYRGRTFRVLAVHDPDETRRYLVARTMEETP
jgi:SPP1 family predicted phage head-tail adaptor